MTQATQPVRGRGTVLTALATAIAVIASVALVPLASAATNPVAPGSSTVVTLNSAFKKKLKKNKIKLTGISPATVKGKTITLPIESGSAIDVAGAGELIHEGGLQFKHKKKKVKVRELVLNTTTLSLSGKLGGKTLKIASVKGMTPARNGFGVNVTISALKLTGKAAKELNKKLGFKGKKKPFKGNQKVGGSTTTTQPKTIGVLANSNATLALSTASLKKLKHVGTPPFPEGASPVEVQLSPVAPTQVVSLSPVTAAFPFSEGGNIAPDAKGGVLHTAGGLKLVQNLEVVSGIPGNVTTLTMGNIWLDLATDKASVEVSIENPKTPAANKGPLGRASIADIDMSTATITSDPATHTVTVQNATAKLQEVTAQVLNEVFIEGLEKASPAFVGQQKFAAGDLLGTVSFTATTE